MADAAPITRRALVIAGGAALGAAALPGGISRALAVEPPLVATAGAASAAFDAAAFVADVQAAGLTIGAPSRVHQPDGADERPAYWIGPGADGGFGRRHHAIMRRWNDAIEACPDHVARVVAHLAPASA